MRPRREACMMTMVEGAVLDDRRGLLLRSSYGTLMPLPIAAITRSGFLLHAAAAHLAHLLQIRRSSPLPPPAERRAPARRSWITETMTS